MPSPLPAGFRITPWSIEYTEWLRTSLRAFLLALYDNGGDMSPTASNIDKLLSLGLALANAGDPALIATVEHAPAAFVLWGDPQRLQSPLNRIDSRWKTCHAIGSFTEPAYRSHKVAESLRDRGLEMAKAAGYERVIGPVLLQNMKGVRYFMESQYAWPTSVQMDLRF